MESASSEARKEKQSFLECYGLAFSVWFVLLMFLGYPEFSLLSCFFQALFVLWWSYYGHIAAHSVSTVFPFNYINPHVSIHHDKYITIPRWLNLTIETFTDLFSFIFLLVLQNILGVHILSEYIVLGGALIYIAVHIFNYSLNGSESHILHHKNTFCNYGPDFMDVIFNTRCDPNAPYDDMNVSMVYGLGGILLVYLAKYSKSFTV
jgi:hypothetical protein